MAHWENPQLSLPDDSLANDDSSYYWQTARPDLEREVGDHHRVVVYSAFYDQAIMHANGVMSTAGALAVDGSQLPTESRFAGSQPFYHPSQPGELVYDPNQLPHPHANEPLEGSNQPAMFNSSQTATYPLVPHLDASQEQYYGSFHAGPSNQSRPYVAQPNDQVFQPLEQQEQGRLGHPPVYLTTDSIPMPSGGFLLAPPAYNYAANHPSSANNNFLNSLLQGGANRLAHIFMDASSDMWIHACNNVVGKDGPTMLLVDRIINNAAFRQMLKSPHLQVERCLITVCIPDRPGGRQVIEKQVPTDTQNADFMRAFRNELQRIPDRIYDHMWKCSHRLLQPSAQHKGIFPGQPGAFIDAATNSKLRWAFTKNDEWGFGIFHEILEDENGFKPGRWFHNADFLQILQEGMFSVGSPSWFGFIDGTTDVNSSWKMAECPTAHLFSVSISWLIVTARCDFLRMRAVTGDWVSNTRIEEVKAFTKFLEAWFLTFCWPREGGSQILSERAERFAFMLRHGLSPLQDI